MALNVAIIGCGVSGLTSIKCCLDAGLNPVCFEQQSWLGGVWNYTDEKRPNVASVHKSTVTNISKLMTSFSDFPIPKEFPNYMPQRLVQQYLEMYAKEFDLEKYVQFNTEVVKLKRSADHKDTGKWLVFIRKLNGVNCDEIITKLFDAVMICNGHYSDQVKPIIPGIEKFKGVQLHSGDYRTFHPYVGKRVVIVGCGHSAGDIAVELSYHAAQVYLSTRSGCYVFTRLGNRGQPFDLYICRASRLLPKLIALKLAPGFLNKRYDFKTFGLEPSRPFGLQKFAIVNDELPQRIMTGSIVVKGDVKRIEEDSVVLEGAETLDNIDVIVFATGFKPNYSFAKDIIEVKDNYYTSLYKHMFLPDAARHTLAVIGAEGLDGSILPASEMQARVAAEVFTGRCSLPSRDIMEKEIARRESLWLKAGATKSNFMRVRYISYMDELGEMIGAKPDLWYILKEDPKLAFQCYFGSAVSSQYRLQGPNPWKGAREHIMTLREQYLFPLSTRKCSPPTERNSYGVLAFIVLIVIAVVAVMLHA